MGMRRTSWYYSVRHWNVSVEEPDMDTLKLIWILTAAYTVVAQDKIPVTMVTTHPFEAESTNPPEYHCYVSSPDTDIIVESSRVVKVRGTSDSHNPKPPAPRRVTDARYPINSTVYTVPLKFGASIPSLAMGVYSCDISGGGRPEYTVSNVLMDSGTYSRPSDDLVTQTVNVGDINARLEMDIVSVNTGIVSWRRNGVQLNTATYFNIVEGRRVINFIPEIIAGRHDGIYYPRHDTSQGGNSPLRAIRRVIVRRCPANHWAPLTCYGVCDYCYNGGVCDDDTGRCICAPGFMGPNCLTACGGNRFGPDCEFYCSYETGADEESCSGLQFCLLDPYGCRCNTGWKDLGCEVACENGEFGASCLQSCNCDGDCDRFTGACNGTCVAGWSGDNCQIPDVCPTGYYGPDCTEKCYCKNDVDCDKTTGECPNQDCAPAYMVYSGSVTCRECQGASYGESCLQSCRCIEEYCDKISGRCRGSCLAQWVDSFFCLAGFRNASSSKFNPGATTEITCEIDFSGTSFSDLTVNLSRDPSSLHSDGIDNIIRTIEKSTFTVANVTDGEKLYCLMLTKGKEIVADLPTTVNSYVLPVLSSRPSLMAADTTSLSIQWRIWSKEFDDVGDPPIVAYVPHYRNSLSEQWIRGAHITSNGSLTFTVSNLTTDTLYDFSVATVREGERGEGPMGPVAQFRTSCDVSGTFPVNVSATVSDATASSVNVSWQRPEDIKCSTDISFFFVYVVEDGKDPKVVTQATGDASWVIVEDLEEGDHSFVVTLVINDESNFSQKTKSVFVKGPGPPPNGSSGGLITVIVAIIGLVIIIILVLAVFLYRKRTHDDEEKKLVSYNRNEIKIDGVSNHYTAEDEKVKKLGDDTESEEEIDDGEGDVPSQHEPTGIKVSELREYINTNLQDRELEQEFSRLYPGKQYPWNVAEKKENRTKNRFRNMYTYDHSRVVLNKQPNDPHSDYYNASFIMTDEDKKPFIAAQGPNKASLNDFWRMIWSQNISTIVMVTNLVEKGRDRCLQYWPAEVGSSSMFGDIEVHWNEKTEFADYVIRKLECGTSFQTRTVYQLHFTSWPDMGTPKQPTPLIAFTKHAKLIHKNVTTPMLVHCSAGIGRTGTFIALYTLLDVVLQEKIVDVYSFVEKMRESRINMIQTGKQYVYLYKCLLEASLTTETGISRGQVSQLAADESTTAIRKEYEILRELENDTLVYAEYLKKQGGVKRPFSMSEQAYNLSFCVDGNLLKSFKKSGGFVTVKHPDADSIDGLWKLVHSWKCPVMVTIDNVNNKPYWPESGSVKYATTTVHFKSVASKGQLTMRKFDVTEDDQQEVIALKHIELTANPAREDVEAFADLVAQVNKLQANSTLDGPTIVLCGNGEAMSGVFCAVLSETERLEITGRMDVFKTVRQLKETNGDIVPSEMDYLLCYKILFCYLQGNRTYDNF